MSYDFSDFDDKKSNKYDFSDFEEGPSQLEAGLRGAFKGASLGFIDELAGGLEAGGQAVGIKGLGGTFSDIGLQKPVGLDTDKLKQIYEQARDVRRQKEETAKAAHPGTFLGGELAGGLATGFGVKAPASALGRIAQSAITGATYGAGTAEQDIGKDALWGALLGGGFSAGSEVLQAGFKAGAPIAAKGFEKLSDVFTRRATGATAKQARKFAPGVEKYLREKGIVSFGDTAEDIAKKAHEKMGSAGAVIDDVMRELDASGATIDKQAIMNKLIQRYDKISDKPALVSVAKKLKGMIEDIGEISDDAILPSTAEQAKRDFAKQSKNLFGREEQAKAEKELYRGYRDVVEDIAQENVPASFDKFKEAKDVYGMLSPIKEAAQQKAEKAAQESFGSFGDIFAAGAGGAIGGVPGVIASSVGRRVIAPRVSSSLAVTTDFVSKLLKAAPEKLGKFDPILKNAAHRGPHAVAVTDFLLSEQNPEYRQMKRNLEP